MSDNANNDAENDTPSRDDEWVSEAVRLTRLSRVDESNAEVYIEERDSLVGERGYRARVREDDTLVLYPDDWVVDGTVRVDKIEDKNRALELPLDPEGRAWEEVHDENRSLLESFAESVEDEAHVFNASAFAEFVENHYSISVRDARQKHVREFLDEYYVRNVWPSEDAAGRVGESLSLLFDSVGLEDDLVNPKEEERDT